MFRSRDELEEGLWRWLDKSSGRLADAREFLGSGSAGARRGLGDSQIANWRRRHGERRLPETFVEGAALYHCARGGLFDSVEHTGIRADSFWHIFFVRGGDDDENDSQPRLNCGILRYWENARSLRGADHLTHFALRSIDEAAAKKEPRATAGEKPEKFDKNKPEPRQLGRPDAGFDPKYDPDGSLFTSWTIADDPHDYGYAVDFPNAIKNDSDEAVGGSLAIPVGVAHQLVFLPKRAVTRLVDLRLAGNPRGLPSAFSLLPGGNPVLLMESYFGIRDHGDHGIKGDSRRLGHWFKQGPQVVEGTGSTRLPQAIREDPLYKEAERYVQEGRCVAFSTRIADPPPFLSYFMVF